MANDRQYFTIIPNIIEDMDLSAIAFRLYFHIKRVAGEDGVCYQTTKTLAEKCNVSTGSISKAKEELRSKKLIRKTTVNTGRGKPLHTIKIVDVWNQNMSHYSSSKFINSTGEFISSTGEIKKNPLRKTLKKDMADESDPDSGKDKNSKEIILQYPPLYQGVIQKFSEYFSIDPPNNKERDFRTWITGADAFVKACGERDPINVMTIIYQKWRSNGKPYTVTDLYSLVKLARVKEEKKKPMKTISAPEGWDGK